MIRCGKTRALLRSVIDDHFPSHSHSHTHSHSYHTNTSSTKSDTGRDKDKSGVKEEGVGVGVCGNVGAVVVGTQDGSIMAQYSTFISNSNNSRDIMDGGKEDGNRRGIIQELCALVSLFHYSHSTTTTTTTTTTHTHDNISNPPLNTIGTDNIMDESESGICEWSFSHHHDGKDGVKRGEGGVKRGEDGVKRGEDGGVYAVSCTLSSHLSLVIYYYYYYYYSQSPHNITNNNTNNMDNMNTEMEMGVWKCMRALRMAMVGPLSSLSLSLVSHSSNKN